MIASDKQGASVLPSAQAVPIPLPSTPPPFADEDLTANHKLNEPSQLEVRSDANKLTAQDAESLGHAHLAVDRRQGTAKFALDDAQPLNPRKFPNPPKKEGQSPKTTIPNVQYMLREYGITARYDVIKKKLWVTMPGYEGSPDNIDNVAITQINSLATLNGLAAAQVPAIVEVIGDRNQYNPVADWIHGKLWDGNDRLPAIYATLGEREGFPRSLKEILIHRWLLSAAAAALMPSGFRGRGVLTLQGPQGIGKTAWTRALVPDPQLAQAVIKLDHHLDAGNKDSLLSAVTHWIVEIGELDGSLRRDIARLKGFLTADEDKVRRPYARANSEYSRKTVFCATVNDENFLIDSTGNTRFWTIPVVHINYEHGIDMQQVFAQIADEYRRGVQWWLTAQEEEWLNEQNKNYRSVSALREMLLDRLDLQRIGESDLPTKTCIDLLRGLGFERPSNAQCKECGALLRELLGDPKRINGRDKWRIPFTEVDDSDLYG